MKPLLHLIILLIAWTTNVEARVGETKAQIDERYGEGGLSDIQRQVGATTYKYFKNSFQIEVVIFNGKSIWEIIQRQDQDRYITDQNIQDILDGYRKPGESWELNRATKVWEKSGQPKLIAYRWPGHEDYLCIKDKAVWEELEKKNTGAKGL